MPLPFFLPPLDTQSCDLARALTDKVTLRLGTCLEKAALSPGSLRSPPRAAQGEGTALQPGQTKPGHPCYWNLPQGEMQWKGKKERKGKKTPSPEKLINAGTEGRTKSPMVSRP